MKLLLLQVHNMITKNGDNYVFDFASQYRQEVKEKESSCRKTQMQFLC